MNLHLKCKVLRHQWCFSAIYLLNRVVFLRTCNRCGKQKAYTLELFIPLEIYPESLGLFTRLDEALEKINIPQLPHDQRIKIDSILRLSFFASRTTVQNAIKFCEDIADQQASATIDLAAPA